MKKSFPTKIRKKGINEDQKGWLKIRNSLHTNCSPYAFCWGNGKGQVAGYLNRRALTCTSSSPFKSCCRFVAAGLKPLPLLLCSPGSSQSLAHFGHIPSSASVDGPIAGESFSASVVGSIAGQSHSVAQGLPNLWHAQTHPPIQ